MKKSVIQQDDMSCYVCGTTYDLHMHHIFYGTANRKKSEKYGLKIYLCARHHNMSNEGVHFNSKLDDRIKEMAQTYYESHYGDRSTFIAEFGRSWL